MAVPRSRSNLANNRSSGLRASVLDAAIELGIGNDTVAKWIFDPVEEEDEEEEEQPKPAVATSVITSNDSEESYRTFHPGPYPSIQSEYIGHHPSHNVLNSSTHSPSFDSPNHGVSFGVPISSQSSHTSSAGLITSRISAKHNKLRKSRPDGYASDGGYISDRTGPKKKTKKKEKDNKNGYDSDGDSVPNHKKKVKTTRDAIVDGEESDGGYLSESTRKRSFFTRNKKKPQPVPERQIVPPLPSSSSLPHPKIFGNSRSATPNTFTSGMDSTRESSSVESHDYSRSTTPSAAKDKPRVESVQGLTKAFKDDAMSIAESVDWSNAYSHFPRIVGPQPPLPTFPSEPSAPQILSKMPEITSSLPRPPKTRPSPLLLSPGPSGYSHASEASPVPSEFATITPDPKSSGAVRHALAEAVSITQDISWKPQTLTPPPSSSSTVTPSSGYVVIDPNSPLPSPSGPLRPPRALARYDVPPPSPPPSGPLPRLPTPPDSGSSRMTSIRFGLSPHSASSRNVNPALPIPRGKDSPFPANPTFRVDDQPLKNPFLSEAYDKRAQIPQSLVPSSTGADDRIPPAGSFPSVPHHKKPKSSMVRIDNSLDDDVSESMSNEDVSSILSDFLKQNGIESEEDDMGYLDMNNDSDSEEEDEEDMPVRDRSFLMDGEKNVKVQKTLPKNVYTKEDRERERRGVNAGRHVAPDLPLPPPPRSILRNPRSLKT